MNFKEYRAKYYPKSEEQFHNKNIELNDYKHHWHIIKLQIEYVFGLCKPPYEKDCPGCVSAKYIEQIKKLCK